MTNGKIKILAIVGPTASGKTALAIEVAKHFSGRQGLSLSKAEIISVDSRQVYRGMDIGTAKEKKDVWGIDLVDPDQEYSVAEFKEYAQKKIEEIQERGHLPLLVGGTGMWLKAIIDNLDLAATASDSQLRASLEARSLDDLFDEYKQLDPFGAEIIDQKNKRRVVRALEVTKLTGRPWSQMQTKGESQYDVLQIGLLVSREELNKRINKRVDEMMAQGLIDEVRRLRDQYGCDIKSMTGIGYRQLCKFLSGEESLENAIEEIKKDTRQYAKRQMTWFKKDERIMWVDSAENVEEFVTEFLKTKPLP